MTSMIRLLQNSRGHATHIGASSEVNIEHITELESSRNTEKPQLKLIFVMMQKERPMWSLLISSAGALAREYRESRAKTPVRLVRLKVRRMSRRI
ncbi:hypothetical protein E4U52_008289 [Claviceps spartinae]|nr:hypothetical protein E4U52_008289 [Claviceps spartinae]